VLRITREADSVSQTLRIEGRLVGAWVEVLRKAWNESRAAAAGSRVVVDLGAVSFADREGRALLMEVRKSGTALINVSEFMRHILADSEDESDRKGE